jgi:hypothetical protein
MGAALFGLHFFNAIPREKAGAWGTMLGSLLFLRFIYTR